jgi:hypothetical protein
MSRYFFQRSFLFEKMGSAGNDYQLSLAWQ